MTDIKITKLDNDEVIRYLEYKNATPDEAMSTMMKEAEEMLLKACEFRYVYHLFDIEKCDGDIIIAGTNLRLRGKSINEHLKGCDKAILVAGTISAQVDRLLIKTSVNDLLKTLIYDAMANVAVEQGMEKLGDMLKDIYSEYHHSFRYGIGYGDLSVDVQSDVLEILNAHKLIGLTVNDSNVMMPTKSITAIIGLSKEKLPKKSRDCKDCNMYNNCRFRNRGERCNE